MPQMVRHKHMQTHAQVAWWETLNSKLKFTFIWENSRENNMLFFHQWYFWIKQPKSSPSLHPSQWCYDSSCVDFLGPIVCFLLVDNDIMTEWIHADRKYLEQKDSEVISAHVWTQSTSRVMTKHKNTLWVLDNKQHCVKMSCSSLSRCSEGSKPTWHQCYSTCLDEV